MNDAGCRTAVPYVCSAGHKEMSVVYRTNVLRQARKALQHLTSLSDGTTARFKIEDLPALGPERLDSSRDKAGEQLKAVIFYDDTTKCSRVAEESSGSQILTAAS